VPDHRPCPVVLTTHRLVLREFTDADTDALFAIYGDPATVEQLSFSPRTREQVAAILRRITEAARTVPRVDYTLAVCLRTDGTMLGTGRLALGQPDAGGPSAGLDPDAGAAQFGLAIRADHWRRGYGREVLAQLVQYAFDVLGVQSLWGARGPANQASRALMDQFGFAEDFTIPGHIVKDGVPRDSIVHTLSRAVWTKRRDAKLADG
jgi:[ribosomal protein S5]-alanine N-acetyltransferase